MDAGAFEVDDVRSLITVLPTEDEIKVGGGGHARTVFRAPVRTICAYVIKWCWGDPFSPRPSAKG